MIEESNFEDLNLGSIIREFQPEKAIWIIGFIYRLDMTRYITKF